MLYMYHTKGKWEWKTTQTLQQLLIDAGEINLKITRSMNSETIVALKQFLNSYHFP